MEPTIYDMTHACDVIRMLDGMTETLQARMGTGGNQIPLIVMRGGQAVTEECFTESGRANFQESKIGNALRAGNGQLHGGGETLVTAPTLTASNDPSRSPQSSEVTAQVDAVLRAFAQNQLGEVRVSDVCGTLNQNSNASGRNTPMVEQQMQVRRLTPKECERLQGFPDDYTKISWRGKDADDCPDSPRYKAIGNSWAVPCVAWIGRRIDIAMRYSEL